MNAQDYANQVNANLQLRNLVLQQSTPIWIKVGTFTQATNAYVPGQALTMNIAPQNVGLIRRFVVEFSITFAQGAAETQTATQFGVANAFSQVILTDFNNLSRVNTTGLHLKMVESARRQLAGGSAFTSDNPYGIGSNYAVQNTPASVTTAQTINGYYEIPCSYSDTDLRGALFAQQVGANANLQFTLNPQFSCASTADGTMSVYKSSTAQLGNISAYTINVWQETLDQLPRDTGNNYLLPSLDIGTQYFLYNSTQTGLAANQQFTIPFQNARQFLSTFLIYDNGGVLNAGTDVTTISLTAANTANFFNLTPKMLALVNGRWKINDDWPKGVYYIDTRAKPVNTANIGNVAINFTPSAVSANSLLFTYFEGTIAAPLLQQAASLPAT